jgi:hypothetical protein
MPRLTKEERAELEARLADDDADDDESDEVTVPMGAGTFTGTFRRARQLGLVSLPEPKADPKAKRVSVLTPRSRGTGS